MSLAAFLGGGKDQKGQGIFGRANAVAEEDRQQQNKLQQIALEQQLKNAGTTSPGLDFTLDSGRQNAEGNKLYMGFISKFNPMYAKDHEKLDQAKAVMRQFSAIESDEIKDKLWASPDIKEKLNQSISIIKQKGYKQNISQAGTTGSMTGINEYATYQDPWSKRNIWDAADKEILGYDKTPVDAKTYLQSIGIEEAKNPANGLTVNTSSRYSQASTDTIVGASPELLGIGSQLGKGAQPTEVQITNLVEKFNEEDGVIWGEFSAVLNAISGVSPSGSTTFEGGNTYGKSTTFKTETGELQAIQEQQNAVNNGFRTGITMAQLGLGYTDANGDYQPPMAVVGGALDIVTGLNNVFDSLTGAAGLFTGSKRVSKAQQAVYDNEKFVTGKNEDGQDITRKRYGGITLEKYMKHGLLDTDSMSKAQLDELGLDKMYKYKALQIHLSFQLAIAMQGFQGGKAVSDADFDRAWMLLTGNTGKSIFGRMASPDGIRESLKTVVDNFARMSVWNRAYLESKDGSRRATANTVLALYDAKAKEEGVELGEYAAGALYDDYGNVAWKKDVITGVQVSNKMSKESEEFFEEFNNDDFEI